MCIFNFKLSFYFCNHAFQFRKTLWLTGRVHDAVVTAVNNATSCVTVEWFERGETKGKEVFHTVIQLYWCVRVLIEFGLVVD